MHEGHCPWWGINYNMISSKAMSEKSATCLKRSIVVTETGAASLPGYCAVASRIVNSGSAWEDRTTGLSE